MLFITYCMFKKEKTLLPRVFGNPPGGSDAGHQRRRGQSSSISDLFCNHVYFLQLLLRRCRSVEKPTLYNLWRGEDPEGPMPSGTLDAIVFGSARMIEGESNMEGLKRSSTRAWSEHLREIDMEEPARSLVVPTRCSYHHDELYDVY